MVIDSIQHMMMICSSKKSCITPVYNCIHTLTATVMTKTVKEAMFAIYSEPLLFATEGAMKPIQMHIMVVAVSLDS
ncbi:hypothetical protein ACHQM5_018011 [Ranunculus cassubicifolius]